MFQSVQPPWRLLHPAGISVAMGIMAIEWALFLVLAWYLEQVLPSGEDLGEDTPMPVHDRIE